MGATAPSKGDTRVEHDNRAQTRLIMQLQHHLPIVCQAAHGAHQWESYTRLNPTHLKRRLQAGAHRAARCMACSGKSSSRTCLRSLLGRAACGSGSASPHPRTRHCTPGPIRSMSRICSLLCRTRGVALGLPTYSMMRPHPTERHATKCDRCLHKALSTEDKHRRCDAEAKTNASAKQQATTIPCGTVVPL